MDPANGRVGEGKGGMWRICLALALIGMGAACSSEDGAPQGAAGGGGAGTTTGAGGDGAQGGAGAGGAGGASGAWVSAYYAAWTEQHLPPAEVDASAVSHIMHFALVPVADGSLDAAANGVTDAQSDAIVGAAHAAGKKAMITIGGWGSDQGFDGATSAPARAAFIGNIVDFVTVHGYDGVDIDWEPVTAPDQYAEFIPELRAAMDAAPAPLLLTTAVMGVDPPVIAAQAYFDQINVMTYDMSGPWPGWVTWHNAPVHDGGFTFPSTGEPVPSADAWIAEYLAAGVPAERLGIGIDFYGYVWRGGSGTPTGGVTEPRQSWTSPPDVQANVPYHEIVAQYGSDTALWDDAAEAAYISIDAPADADDTFVSLDNEASVQAKAAYVQQRGLGGVIIWELSGGYFPSAPGGVPDPLLRAVKQSFPQGAAP